MTALVVALTAAVALAVWIAFVYRRRETPVAGRGRLAALRVATVAGVLLLLANPTLPTAAGGGPPTRWAAVDGSLSMGVTGPSGSTPWARAREAAAREGDDVRVVVFGEPADGSAAPGSGEGEADPLAAASPRGPESRLAPVLRRAAESGAREVTVYTDLRLGDVPEVVGLRDALGLELRVVDVGEPLRTAGIGALEAPATGRADDPVEVAVEVFGTASAEGATARVELLRDGEAVDEREIRLPAPGRTVAVTFSTALPDRAGPVLWQARVRLDDDAFAGDDLRSAFTDVDPLEGLLALVSLAPDWEPRFLLPVLGRVTGLPTRGWLRVGTDAYLPMDGSGGVLDGEALARVAQDARVLVVHGLDREAPAWLLRAVDEGRRVLVFADDPAGAGSVGIEAGGARAGEWYAAGAAGPLAAAFAGVPWADLPPLSAPLAADSGAAPALEVERAGGGRTGALELQDRGERRRAVVLARGFWRWSFRPGAGTDAYDRLWSGVAGWLLSAGDGAPGGGLGPARPVSTADRAVAWWAPVAPGGRIEVSATAADGEVRVDTLDVGADGRAFLPGRPAGAWSWTARVVAPDSLAARGREWSGRLELEAHTDEFRWPRDTTLVAGGSGDATVRAAGPGRPLRTSPWPWLLLLGLLSAEWILRRRSGLR